MGGASYQNAPDYVEGQLLMDPNTNLEFLPPPDRPKISSLIKQYGIIYFIEVAKYYDYSSPRANNTVDKVSYQRDVK